MNKKALTEADIRSKFITPARVGQDGGKWDLMTQLREEVYFTKGRVIVRGKAVKRGVRLLPSASQMRTYHRCGTPRESTSTSN